jgi:hypothetical protein
MRLKEVHTPCQSSIASTTASTTASSITSSIASGIASTFASIQHLPETHHLTQEIRCGLHLLAQHGVRCT